MQEALFDWLIFQVLGWNVESTSKVSSDNTVKIGVGQVDPGQVGPGQDGILQAGPGQVGLVQVGSFQVGFGQAGRG